MCQVSGTVQASLMADTTGASTYTWLWSFTSPQMYTLNWETSTAWSQAPQSMGSEYGQGSTIHLTRFWQPGWHLTAFQCA